MLALSLDIVMKRPFLITLSTYSRIVCWWWGKWKRNQFWKWRWIWPSRVDDYAGDGLHANMEGAGMCKILLRCSWGVSQRLHARLYHLPGCYTFATHRRALKGEFPPELTFYGALPAAPSVPAVCQHCHRCLCLFVCQPNNVRSFLLITLIKCLKSNQIFYFCDWLTRIGKELPKLWLDS